MIFELNGSDRKKILSLIKNTRHELTIEAAVHGYSPAEIFVDDLENPRSGLFKGQECNVLFGDPTVEDFYWKIFEKIDYYEQVTCDHSGWNPVVEEHHVNRAIRPYTRYSYHLKKEDYIESDKNPKGVEVKVLESNDISSLEYENSDLVKDWARIYKLETLPGLKLATIVIKDNTIVSCSGVDCFFDNKIEIGINTMKDFRGKGYGIMAVNALIKESFSYGISEIGWHCVSTNKGSRRIAEKLGFKQKCSYIAYTPEPPIENVTDLRVSEWIDNAKYYMDKGKTDPAQYWIAAKCWAKVNERDEVIKCFEKLMESNQKWFLHCLKDFEEFDRFSSDERWKEKLKGFASDTD